MTPPPHSAPDQTGPAEPRPPRRSFTERAARVSVRRPWVTIAIWAAIVVVAAVVVVVFNGTFSASEAFLTNPESKQAGTLIDERMPGGNADTELVVMRSAEKTVDDPEFEAAVQEMTTDLTALGPSNVAMVLTYYQVQALLGDETAAKLVSEDLRTTIIPVTLPGDANTAGVRVGPVYDLVQQRAAELTSAGFTVAMTGNATWEYEAHPLSERDLRRGEAIGIPIAVVVLVIVFGAVVAAAVPFVLAIAGIVVALALTALLGQAFSISIFVTNIIVMMGLAVGIDYSLFILSRFREERAAGHDVQEAIGRSASTASRAILFSGITVMLALLGMLMVPFTLFVSMGVGTILVVLAAVAAALTLLPAMLALLGDRINRLKVPFRKQHTDPNALGFWGRAAKTLMRRPVITLVVGVGILAALIVPAFDLQRGEAGVAQMPPELSARQAYDMLAEDFTPGLISPLLVTLDGDQDDPQVQQAVADLSAAVTADGRFQVIQYEKNPAGDFGLLSLALADATSEGESGSRIVAELRTTIIPEAVGDAPVTVLVGGAPAMFADMLKIVDFMTPIVFAVVLTLSFLLLLMVFRSVVISATAVVMNVLSVGAAYGLMTLVFQHGVGADLLGFQRTPAIVTWVPLLLFCVLFGLSMDYQVFLLSRVREHYDRTGDTRGAVIFGISSTSGLITGAALIMVAVFGGMASGDFVIFQQIGFGLAVAVALDVTVVRTLVMPATMTLLGKWNWYMPKWLGWLPGIQVDSASDSDRA